MYYFLSIFFFLSKIIFFITSLVSNLACPFKLLFIFGRGGGELDFGPRPKGLEGHA